MLDTLTGVNLYRDARLIPGTLRGRNTVAAPSDLQRRGLTPDAARWHLDRGRLTRAHRGAYLFGPTKPDLLDRIRAALRVSPPGAVAEFHTAAALLGFGVVASTDIHIVQPSGSVLPNRSGIRVHQSVLPVGEPVLVLGIPCTAPGRTAVDLVRVTTRPLGLSILDAALANDACNRDALIGEISRHGGLPGVRRARELVMFADGRSQCSQESHLRLILHDGGLTDFHPQLPVLDESGRTRYYIDLADPASNVGAEYDEASHLDRNRLRNDRERHNWLDNAGWRMRYFTDRDLYTRPKEIVAILRAAQNARKAR